MHTDPTYGAGPTEGLVAEGAHPVALQSVASSLRCPSTL